MSRAKWVWQGCLLVALVSFNGCGGGDSPASSTSTTPKTTAADPGESGNTAGGNNATGNTAAGTTNSGEPLANTAQRSSSTAGGTNSNTSTQTKVPATAPSTNPPATNAATRAPAKVYQPTADQLSRWSRVPFEPVQLLSLRESPTSGLVSHLVSAPDGRQFITAGYRVMLWRINGTEPEHVFLDLTGSAKDTSVKSLAIANDGKWIAVGDSEGLLHIYNLPDRKEITSRKVFDTGITCIAISPDDQELAMISYDTDVAVYSANNFEKKSAFKATTNSLKKVHYVAANQLAVAGETTSIWSTSIGKAEQQLSRGRYNYALARSRDNKWLAFGERDDLFLWDIAKSQKHDKPFTNFASNELLSFSPDGKFLASANGSVVRIWDTAQQQTLQVMDVGTVPLVGLQWLPETQLLLVASANGWVRVWGTPAQGEKVGMKPLQPEIRFSEPAVREPATVAQWIKAVDFRSFPRLPSAKPRVIDPASIDYEADVKMEEAQQFYQYHLAQAGWTELSGNNPQLPPGSFEFTKAGFNLTASFTANGDNKTMVTLRNNGNYDLRWLPRFDGGPVTDVFSSATTTLYQAKADIVQIETNLLKKLQAAGWTPFARLHTSHAEDPERRDIEFLRNGTVLRVSINKFPTAPDSFHIQTSMSAVQHAIPVPNDASYIEFDGVTQVNIVATTSMSLDQTRAFYEKEMAAQGWLVRRPSVDEQGEWISMSFVRDQDDLFLSLVKKPDNKTLIRAGERLENSSWQLAKPQTPDPKSDAIGIEAADFPVGNGSAKYDSNGKTIEVELAGASMADTIDRYSKQLESLGWMVKGSGVRSDEYTFLTFTKDKKEIDLRARSNAGKIGLNIQGDGILWTKDLPTGKQIISYEGWMRQGRRPASLEWIDQYIEEMKTLKR